MTWKERETISKLLSLVLRHKPETIDIQLDANGWTSVAELILKSNEGGVNLDFEKLAEIVETSQKARFAFNETKDRIRANQGHSVNVDLGYSPAEPPEILFHGTATRFVDSIMASGLEKRERHHVHLSKDWDTAVSVGQRHGKPHIFKVFAGSMHADGYQFFVSENGVWLTDHVPAKYLVAALYN